MPETTPGSPQGVVWALLRLLDAQGSLLWVDCGDGTDLEPAPGAGFHRIVGTEADRDDAQAAFRRGFEVRTGRFAALHFAEHDRFDVVVAPRLLADVDSRRESLGRLRSVLEPDGALVFSAPIDPGDPAGRDVRDACLAVFGREPELIAIQPDRGDAEWIGSVALLGSTRWEAFAELTRHLGGASPESAHVQRIERELAERTRDVRRVHAAFEVASQELAAVLGSRTYRVASVFRDIRHDWRQLFPAPFRLAWLALPTRVQSGLRERLAPLKAWLRGTRVRKIRNTAWPAGQPLVTVVIPCFNYGRYLPEAVASLHRQTFQDFEIVIVDGGSDDGETPRLIAELDSPGARILTRTERCLVGDNRNHGIEHARGKYICCLDADDMLAPTYLQKAVFLAETGGFDLVFPSVQCFGRSQDRWLVQDPTVQSCAAENGISTVALFRRELWSRVGGFRDFGSGADYLYEDWDFWLRTLAAGARAKSIREMLMLYRVHNQGLTATSGRSIQEQGVEIRKANRELLQPERMRTLHRQLAAPTQIENPMINLGRAAQPSGRHVLFALPFTIVGGADTVLLQIARALKESGAEVTIVTTQHAADRGGDNSHRFEAITPRVYHLPRFLTHETQREQFVDSLIETGGVDTVFLVGSSWFYEQLPRLRRRHPGLRVVDQLFNEIGHLASNQKYAKHIDVDVVASEPLRHTLLSSGSRDAGRVVPIVHGVDTEDEFHPDRVDTEEAYRLLPRLRNQFVVVFAGRFSEEKAPLTFLRIAELLWAHENVVFLMIGDGPEAHAVEDALEEAAMGERVIRPGFVDDVRPLLAVADALVIPSKIEGIPIVMLECLSLGVPVVASAVGGIPTVIRDGHAGFLADPEDPQSFADRLEWMLHHPEERAEMATRARELAREKYSLRRMTDEYLRVFQL